MIVRNHLISPTHTKEGEGHGQGHMVWNLKDYSRGEHGSKAGGTIHGTSQTILDRHRRPSPYLVSLRMLVFPEIHCLQTVMLDVFCNALSFNLAHTLSVWCS